MTPCPPRITPRRLKRAKRKAVRVSQCDSCEVYLCARRDSGAMAREELQAVMNDQPLPECGDREPGFWERVNE